MHSFLNKRILVTGGSAGIGLALARQLSAQGAELALLGRRLDALEAAAATLPGMKPVLLPCDISDAAQVQGAFEALRRRWDRLDGLIANAGYCHPGHFHEITPEDADRLLRTNLHGTLYTAHAAVPLLLASGGFLAITSSPAGFGPIHGFSVYGASKAALNHLAGSLRHEYSARGLRVHLLLPPDTNTPGYEAEIKLYPAETHAVLSAGSVHDAEAVAQRFVRGIARGDREITAGRETRLFLFLARHFPRVWEHFAGRQIRRTRSDA